MKKIATLLMACLMLLSMAACGSEPEQLPTTAPAEPGYVFVHNAVEIAMKADAAPILEALGEPKQYTETASCAFSGLDKTYFFGDFYLYTYPMGEQDYVYAIELMSDSVQTQEGLYIGATQAEVERIYGSEGYNGTNGYVLTKGVCRLTIILEEGIVTSIQYDAVM